MRKRPKKMVMWEAAQFDEAGVYLGGCAHQNKAEALEEVKTDPSYSLYKQTMELVPIQKGR